jgi:hypothetical protein
MAVYSSYPWTDACTQVHSKELDLVILGCFQELYCKGKGVEGPWNINWIRKNQNEVRYRKAVESITWKDCWCEQIRESILEN